MATKSCSDQVLSNPKSISEGSIETEPMADEIATLRFNMIEHLVVENKAFFRSQQINDPDITESERRQIAEQLLEQSHKKFLFRFGANIVAEHLRFFEVQRYSDDDEYEIKFLLKDLKLKLKNRVRDVRNRRFMALQKLIDTTTYFSEKEMMAREPLLYDQLIGRYITDGERRLRDGIVEEDSEYSGVLLERISNDHVSELKQKQKRDEQQFDEYDSDDSLESSDNSATLGHTNGIINEKLYPQTPASFRQHWGEFADVQGDSETTCKPPAIPVKRSIPKQNYITVEEKNLLKEEFIGIMHSKFLAGEDTDFNYADVDDNLSYDNIDFQSQDQEDKYFNDDEDSCCSDSTSNVVKDDGMNESEEDELDAYMKQIAS